MSEAPKDNLTERSITLRLVATNETKEIADLPLADIQRHTIAILENTIAAIKVMMESGEDPWKIPGRASGWWTGTVKVPDGEIITYRWTDEDP